MIHKNRWFKQCDCTTSHAVLHVEGTLLWEIVDYDTTQIGLVYTAV